MRQINVEHKDEYITKSEKVKRKKLFGLNTKSRKVKRKKLFGLIKKLFGLSGRNYLD